MANYSEGHILRRPSTGEAVILRGNQWVPHKETEAAGSQTQPAMASAVQPAPAPEPVPGKVPEKDFVTDVRDSGPGEFVRGLVGLGTFPNTMASLAQRGLGAGLSALGATNIGGDLTAIANKPSLMGKVPGAIMEGTSYPTVMGAVEDQTGPLPKPETTGGKMVGSVLQAAPGIFSGPGTMLSKGVQGTLAALGGEGAVQATGAEGTWRDLPTRIAGSVMGARVPQQVRQLVTPNPYNPQGLKDLNESVAEAAANTRMRTSLPQLPKDRKAFKEGNPDLHDAITALNASSSRVGPEGQRLTAAAFNQLSPAQQRTARMSNDSIGGQQYQYLQDSLRDEIAKTTGGGVKRANLQQWQGALDNAMDVSMRGKPHEGAWSGVRNQRQALEEGVEQGATRKGGHLLSGLMGLAGGTAAHYAGARYGLPPGVAASVGMLAGTGASNFIPGKAQLEKMIPGYASYLRNQAWQPGPATTMSPALVARSLMSGDQALPPLAFPPSDQ